MLTWYRPSIGAYFASKPVPLSTHARAEWNVYAVPAAITLVLLIVETIYLVSALPETKIDGPASRRREGKEDSVRDSAQSRLRRLAAIGRLHGLFLLFFSGVGVEQRFRVRAKRLQAEFTLTFLTYDLYEATNAQNGKLLSCESARQASSCFPPAADQSRHWHSSGPPARRLRSSVTRQDWGVAHGF